MQSLKVSPEGLWHRSLSYCWPPHGWVVDGAASCNGVCCGSLVLWPNKSICSSWTLLEGTEQGLEGASEQAEWSPLPLVLCQGRDKVWFLDPTLTTGFTCSPYLLDRSSVLKIQARARIPTPQEEGAAVGAMLQRILGQAFMKFSRVVFQDWKNQPQFRC